MRRKTKVRELRVKHTTLRRDTMASSTGPTSQIAVQDIAATTQPRARINHRQRLP